jgi:hypothetical protein
VNQSPAQLRNAAARQLIARGRLRQALDVLNEAIRLDPRLAESYENRANVFELLGMTPQAEADRRKFTELGGVTKPPEPEGPPPPSKTKIRRRPVAIPMRYPSKPKRRRGSGATLQTAGTVLIIGGLLTAAGIGIYLGLNTLSDALDNGDELAPGLSETPAASQSPGASGTPSATPAPTSANGATTAPTATIVPTPESLTDALSGSPLSFDSLQSAWAAKGISAEATAVNDGVTGTGTTAVSVTLSKDGATMHLAVLFYDDGSGPGSDFDLGEAITPKEGRSVPAGSVAWWNANVVVVVLDQDPTIKPDAFDAFING